MGKANELTGMVFGKWSVLHRVENNYKNCTRWLCVCECGKEKIVYGFHLTSGKSKSCGCANFKNLNYSNLRHGMTGTKIHQAWTHMRARCNNADDKNYKNYGGRGITVCVEWDSFESFYDWSMANGFRNDLSIDRIDNNGIYEPNNCRWTTNKVQQNNTRFNRLISINGTTKTFTQWTELIGINKATLEYRIKNKWSDEQLLSKPNYKVSHGNDGKFIKKEAI